MHDLPPGFHPWPGTRQPRDEGPFQIMLGNGFVDTQHEYTRGQLIWIWEERGKPKDWDIIAVRKV